MSIMPTIKNIMTVIPSVCHFPRATAVLTRLTLGVRFLLGRTTTREWGRHFRSVHVRLLLTLAYILLEADSLVPEPVGHLQRWTGP